jgi:hypothetical protein
VSILLYVHAFIARGTEMPRLLNGRIGALKIQSNNPSNSMAKFPNTSTTHYFLEELL